MCFLLINVRCPFCLALKFHVCPVCLLFFLYISKVSYGCSFWLAFCTYMLYAQVTQALLRRRSAVNTSLLRCGGCWGGGSCMLAYQDKSKTRWESSRSFQQIFDLIIIGIEYKNIIQVYITLWFALYTSFSFSFTVV